MDDAPDHLDPRRGLHALGEYERAIALVGELRRLEFSPHTIMFELCEYHGFTDVDATRIVREATREAEAEAETGESHTMSSEAGARDGRRWPDVARVAPSTKPR